MKKFFAVTIFILFGAMAFAQNANIKRIGPTTFSVGAYARPFMFEKVLGSTLHWDWAACIVMVLNYNGLNVSQEQVMSLVDMTVMGTPQDLIFNVNKTTPHAWGPPSKIYTSTATLDADVLFDELSAGRPLIMAAGSVGTEGRAFVVTAMSYTIKFDANGQQTGITPATVTLRDPWPSGLTNRTVNWADFVGLTASLYTIKVEFKKE
ncbi:MAG: papain-like cysteine protease family protein [Bacteroidota bacterium]